ncbi:MAG TPA: hypothetical protein VJW94_10770 [Candidatus Acidoferrum sp.]|nr:hypothetical protein [Candidatus Acidoferrum sp.]
MSRPSSSLVSDEEACLALNGHCEKGVAAAARPSDSNGVSPDHFVRRLAAVNIRLVLGLHAFYELARTLQSSRSGTPTRGTALFRYLGQYLETNMLCAKDQSELLPAEMLMLKKGPERVEFFYPREDHLKIVAECQRLANGEQSELARQFLSEQLEFAARTRKGIVGFLDARPELKKRLSNIAPQALETWLRRESVSIRGHSNLARHIAFRFPEVAEDEVTEYAIGLFDLPMKRYARGLVRADLYLHWRYAQFDALPKDLVDDVYHVLNSSYCDMYATADPKQKYARLLLTSNTKTAIWPRHIRVDNWMESLS